MRRVLLLLLLLLVGCGNEVSDETETRDIVAQEVAEEMPETNEDVELVDTVEEEAVEVGPTGGEEELVEELAETEALADEEGDEETVEAALTLEDAVDAFEVAGLLEPDNIQPLQSEETGAAEEGVQFAIPILEGESGQILRFASPEAASQAAEALSAEQDLWVFNRGNLLVVLSGAITEAQAQEYALVLDTYPEQ